MPRKPRVFISGGVYHVYCRVAGRDPWFANKSNAEAFLNIVDEVRKRDGFSVLAWCVMPTHYHLALRTGEVPLWRTMRLIQGRFALRFNRSLEIAGPVWQGRYKARLVSDEAQVKNLLAYIHLNPVQVGNAKSPDKYRFSGHNELTLQKEAKLVDVNTALQLFAVKKQRAVEAYRALVLECSKVPWSTNDPGRLPWWRREDGQEKTARTRKGRRVDDARSSTIGGRPQLDAKAFVQRACRELGCDPAELVGPGRFRSASWRRDLVGVLGAERYGLKVRDLAQVLERTPDQMSRWVGRGGRRKAESEAFRAELDRLDKAVARATGKIKAKGKVKEMVETKAKAKVIVKEETKPQAKAKAPVKAKAKAPVKAKAKAPVKAKAKAPVKAKAKAKAPVKAKAKVVAKAKTKAPAKAKAKTPVKAVKSAAKPKKAAPAKKKAPARKQAAAKRAAKPVAKKATRKTKASPSKKK